MTADDFRRLVLGLLDVVEGAHMGHPDFRVNGRIFSSLHDAGANVKLTPEEQARLMADAPRAFTPASGAWGRHGWTFIDLRVVDAEILGEAATIAWQLARAMPAVKPRKPAGTTAQARDGAVKEATVKRASVKKAPGKTAERKKAVVKKAAPTVEAAEVDAYIAASDPKVRPILERIRALIRREAPKASERISYRMPAFFHDGALVYYAPFTHHIGMFPPVKGNAALTRDLARYRGEKGNLRFPLGEPMPYPLIRRVVRARLAEQMARAAAKAKKAAR